MLKKIVYLLLIMVTHEQIQATVKVFVNDSPKTFFIRMFDGKNNVTAITLKPGAVQDVFLKYDSLSKIIIQDERHKMTATTMAHHILRSETHPINQNMIFIVHKDATFTMYKGTTSRDKSLQDIDTSYTKQGLLPTIDLAIHTTRTNELYSEQSLSYSLKSNKSFLQSVESLFKPH